MRNYRGGRWRFLNPAALMAALILSSACAGVERSGGPDQWRETMQPPLEASVAESLAHGPSMSKAISLALVRSPGLEAERRRWLAAINVEPQATSLPDPMLQFGYQFDSVETRVGPQRWNLGVTQSVPWWRKLWARGHSAATQADIARLRYEAAARDLVIDVKDAYYELYYLDQALPITQKIETQLRNEAVLAYGQLDSGKTQLNEAFRAESQAAQLGYDRILLSEQRAAQAERLRSLLNLPPDTQIGRVGIAPFYDVSDDLNALYERAEAFSQVLRTRGLEVQKAQYDAYLAKLARIPDVSLGFNFIQTGEAITPPPPMMKPTDSGKDPFIGLISMTCRSGSSATAR